MDTVAPPNIAPLASPESDGVTAIEYRVRQQYRYEYASPVHDLQQRIVMLPPELHGAQCLVRADLRVDGADELHTRYYSDRFGNVVYHFASPTIREAVHFTAEFTVRRYVSAQPFRASAAQVAPFLAPTALTASCPRIVDAARSIAARVADRSLADLERQVLPLGAGWLDADGVRQWASAVLGGAWAASALTYESGMTGVHTPAATALQCRRGVCQDYAHVAIALLRALHIPVRYVSGHLLGEGAPHAWIEALLPDPDVPGQFRVVPYDPTHRVTPTLDYVTIAVGRDYGDITPTSGTFYGVLGRFTARKQAWIVNRV
ncbi:MAG: transglutaminase family protein [bacterium]